MVSGVADAVSVLCEKVCRLWWAGRGRNDPCSIEWKRLTRSEEDQTHNSPKDLRSVFWWETTCCLVCKLASVNEKGRLGSPQSHRTTTPLRNRYREVHHISSAEHEERLKEHNWTEDDFEAGFQEKAHVGPEDAPVSEKFLAYQALVKDTLATGEVSKQAGTIFHQCMEHRYNPVESRL